MPANEKVPGMRILTNLAFGESGVWSGATESICGAGESPDGMGAWRQAWRLLRRRRGADAAVTMGARASLAYGLLCAALGMESRQVMMEYFLDRARPESVRWRLKTALYRLVARRALGILTNSRGEVESTMRRFGLEAGKVRYVPMYSTVAPGDRGAGEGYALSAGRTLRDNATLLEAARRLSCKLVWVTGREDEAPGDLPENVEWRREIPLEEHLRLMAGANAVVVPLLPAERSTGQVVVLEAMAMGKPVVATRLAGTVDLIEDGRTGLLTEAGDAEGLAAAVERVMRDGAFARRLGLAALEEIRRWGLSDCRGRAMLEAVEALVRRGAEEGRR